MKMRCQRRGAGAREMPARRIKRWRAVDVNNSVFIPLRRAKHEVRARPARDDISNTTAVGQDRSGMNAMSLHTEGD